MVKADSDLELEAFDRTYRPALIRFFQRRSSDHAEAEDLVQEVFIRLANSDADTIRSRHAYIFQIAANLLRDRHRRRQVRSNYAEYLANSPDQGLDMIDPHRVAEAHDLLRLLYAELGSLPERARRIFTLYRIEKVQKSIIARQFGISESAVEKQVTRTMAILIDRLGGRP